MLQLHKIDETREYAEFMHLPRKRFTEFGTYSPEITVYCSFTCKLQCWMVKWKSQVVSVRLHLLNQFDSSSYWFVMITMLCLAAVRQEISDETDRETGRSKQISTVPIHLSIFSPNGM